MEYSLGKVNKSSNVCTLCAGVSWPTMDWSHGLKFTTSILEWQRLQGEVILPYT